MFLALIGPLQSGKTTTAMNLVVRDEYYRRSFAAPVKQATLRMLNAFQESVGVAPKVQTLEDLDEYKKNHLAIRQLQQLVGSGLGRDFYGPETIWVDRVLSDINFLKQTTSNIVIDDCRFPNEYDILKEQGFIFIRLERPYEEWLASLRLTYTDQEIETIMNHPSEIHVAGFEADYTVRAENPEQTYNDVKDILVGLSHTEGKHLSLTR